jgi:hypothetical protein
LGVRVKSHAQLKGHCSQESKDDSGHVTRTDNCDGNIAGANAVIGFDKAESNQDTDRTPDTKSKTRFDFSFDVVPAPTTDNPSQPQPNSIIEFADTTWHGAQTRGDAKVGYKVEFDGTKQSDTGGKKRLHLSAQIVPGAPSRSAVVSPIKSQSGKESIADEVVSTVAAAIPNFDLSRVSRRADDASLSLSFGFLVVANRRAQSTGRTFDARNLPVTILGVGLKNYERT